MRERAEVAQVFRRHFNGQPNFITNEIVAYGETPQGLLYELSKAPDSDLWFKGQYGVTFLRFDGVHSYRDDASQLCASYEAAIACISEH